MEANLDAVTLNGIEYVRNDKKQENAYRKIDGLSYVIVRTQNAGVFSGYLADECNQRVVLRKARRLWYWSGAASLSQLAMEGVSKPQDCKFPCEVDEIILPQTIEIIYATEKSRDSIAGVAIWKA